MHNIYCFSSDNSTLSKCLCWYFSNFTMISYKIKHVLVAKAIYNMIKVGIWENRSELWSYSTNITMEDEHLKFFFVHVHSSVHVSGWKQKSMHNKQSWEPIASNWNLLPLWHLKPHVGCLIYKKILVNFWPIDLYKLMLEMFVCQRV